MKRMLRSLLAGVVLSLAFGAVSSPGAWGAEFHCAADPCAVSLKPDGTGKTAHHVFIFATEAHAVGVTCNGISGTATFVGKTTSTLTITDIEYQGCTFLGSPTGIRMNECDYRISSTTFSVSCPAGKAIEMNVGTCVSKIPSQEAALLGSPVSINGETEITVPITAQMIGFVGEACAGLFEFTGEAKLEYTTGNTILKGQSDEVSLFCSVKSCRQTLKADGTGKTAHHVLVVKKGASSGAITCNKITGEGTSGETATELTLTNLGYEGCNLAGSEAVVRMNKCHYRFQIFAKKGSLECPGGANVEVEAGKCLVKFGPQGPLSGISYLNLAEKTQITSAVNVKGIVGSASEGCAGLLGFTGAFTEGEYTTGNTLVTGEAEGGLKAKVWTGADGPMANLWWK